MRESFDEAYAQCAACLYRIAVVHLGSPADAEDVLQDAFLRLLSRREPFQDPEHRKRWLIRVTVNLCRDRLRSPWRQTVPYEGQTPLREAEHRAVWEQVLALPEPYRAAIHLHYYEGYSVREIAEILKLSQSAVKMRLSRGRQALRLEMEADG